MVPLDLLGDDRSRPADFSGVRRSNARSQGALEISGPSQTLAAGGASH